MKIKQNWIQKLDKKYHLMIWDGIFWIILSSFILGMMLMTGLLEKVPITYLDKLIIFALVLKIILSIGWIKGELE